MSELNSERARARARAREGAREGGEGEREREIDGENSRWPSSLHSFSRAILYTSRPLGSLTQTHGLQGAQLHNARLSARGTLHHECAVVTSALAAASLLPAAETCRWPGFSHIILEKISCIFCNASRCSHCSRIGVKAIPIHR